MDTSKIDLLLQFIIAAAAQRDPWERKLGPIHLIKYAYIADLAHARREGGKTFTGVKWTFHHFGPWSFEVYERIDPAMEEISAQKETMSHPKYEGDFTRYWVEEQEGLQGLEKKLPLHLVLAVKNAIREFTNDTTSLLHHVYLSEPMLKAAPEEALDFSRVSEEEVAEDRELEKEDIAPKTFSEKELKELRARIREKVKAKKRSPRLVPPDPPPVYDEVFYSQSS